MAAEIVNLRGVRKAKARAEREAEATANRALHGRTKVEKARDRDAAARLAKTLDQAKREP
jgi:hypothetical protein